MPTIHPVDRSQVEPRVATQLTHVERKFGMLPNLIATIAHSPAALGAYLGASESLADGELSARERELVALAVAQHNGCAYCLSAHSALAAHAGLGAAEIRQARAGHGDTPRDGALLSFVGRLVERRGEVAEADVAAFRRAGFGEAALVETVAHVALNVFTNYLNNVARTEIDFPLVDVEQAA